MGNLFGFSRELRQYAAAAYNAEELTEEETCDLIRKAREGDEEAYSRVFKAHMRDVFNAVRAKQYACEPNDIEDFVQEGMYGLVKACQWFDPDKAAGNNKFASYARHWIDKYIKDYCRVNQIIIKPDKKFRVIAKMVRAENDYKALYGRMPDLEDLAEILGLSIEEAAVVRNERKCLGKLLSKSSAEDNTDEPCDCSFFDKHTDSSENCIEDLVVERIHTMEIRDSLQKKIDGIDSRIIDLIFDCDDGIVTHNGIARKLGCSRQYVSKHIKDMQDVVREVLNEISDDE
ncbi:MAG: sigma-70 family RNA polymerase sigma factor [Clostridiales bacterium]|nr:sigma-70 family RNA polymerase sigma factor [Clostridiales bacterium]